MSNSKRSADEILEQEFLVVRSKLIEIGAFFDRSKANRGSDGLNSRQQWKLLKAGCDILSDDDGEKAKRLQLLFSRDFESDWRERFGL